MRLAQRFRGGKGSHGSEQTSAEELHSNDLSLGVNGQGGRHADMPFQIDQSPISQVGGYPFSNDWNPVDFAYRKRRGREPNTIAQTDRRCLLAGSEPYCLDLLLVPRKRAQMCALGIGQYVINGST